MDRGALYVPVALWTGAPRHHVAAMAAVDGGVATGALGGEICLWRGEQPHTVLFPRSSDRAAVTALAHVTRDGASLLVAAAMDGMVSVHFTDSGDAIACSHVLPSSAYPSAIHILSAPDPFMLLVAILCYHKTDARVIPRIHVIQISIVGKYRGLLTQVSFIDLEQDTAILSALYNHNHLLTVSSGGRLTTWNMQDMSRNVLQECIVSSPIAIDVCEGMALVLSTNACTLVRLQFEKDLHVITTPQDCLETKQDLVGGCFATSTSVLLWSESGPLRHYSIKEDYTLSLVSTLTQSGLQYTDVPRIVRVKNGVVFSTNGSAGMCLDTWSLGTGSKQVYGKQGTAASVVSYLLDTWSFGPILALGKSDGSIETHHLRERGKPHLLSSHTCAVNALLGMEENIPLGTSSFLVSGDVSGKVCVWNLSNKTCSHSFHIHRTRIQSIAFLSTTKNSILMYVTAEENAFSIFSLQSNSSSTSLHTHEDLCASASAQDQMQSVDVRAMDLPKADLHVACTLLCPVHDSPVVQVYRNSFCDKIDAYVSVSAEGLVYIWQGQNGKLDRVLSMHDGCKFMQQRGMTHPGSIRAPHDRLESRPRIHQISFRGQRSAYAVLHGISSAMHVQVLLLDIRVLSAIHCCQGLSLLLKSNSSQASLATASEPAERDRLLPEIKALSRAVSSGSHRRSFSADTNQQSGREALYGNDTTSQAMIADLRFCLSLLLDWDRNMPPTSLDVLGLYPPLESLQGSISIRLSTGILGPFPKRALHSRFLPDDQDRTCSLALLYPSKASRWAASRRLSAIHSVSINALSMALMAAFAPALQQQLFSTITQHYILKLPSSLRSFKEKSLLTLGFYGLHQDEGIHLTARLLLQAATERLTDQEYRATMRYWTRFYVSLAAQRHQESTDLAWLQQEMKLVDEAHPLLLTEQCDAFHEFGRLGLLPLEHHQKHLLAVLVLSILVLNSPNEADPRLSKLLCLDLIDSISTSLEASTSQSHESRVVPMALAADLLGKGFAVWRDFLSPKMPVLMVSLFNASKRPREDKDVSILVAAAGRTLLELAYADPVCFVNVLGSEALNNRPEALHYLMKAIHQIPDALLPAVYSTVQNVIRCLDPADPQMRKQLMKAATAALRTVTQVFPHADFDQKSQIFAVSGSSQKNVVVLYDLRTATKWKVLEGHSSEIDALAFNASGALLASYASKEDPPTLRVWKAGNHGIFGNLLGFSTKCLRTFPLFRVDAATELPLFRVVRLRWTSSSQVELTREDSTVYHFTINA